ncbi:molecular chaperone GrpE [Leptolyngbya valderiana BDU 20041]|nr:nucleotide exchange factor GrpE [Geitlerinema sp. CS-897]OAB61960.1 molecular chaperone GrpE [Leptolyngbya valderiana BDU 20041]
MDEEKQFENERQATAQESSETAVEAQNTEAAAEASESERASAEGELETPTEEAIDPTAIEAEAAAREAIEREAAEDVATTLETLKVTAEAASAQLEEMKSQYVRLQADFDNFRKRTEKEREALEERAKCEVLQELLPVVDNFERARTQIKPQTDGETNIHKSYQSVYKLMVDCLKRLGVAPMRPEGEEFDPNLHEAVMREATDEYPEGTVMGELMRGYTLGDRVLRHAMVKVAAPPEPVVSSEEAESDGSDA